MGHLIKNMFALVQDVEVSREKGKQSSYGVPINFSIKDKFSGVKILCGPVCKGLYLCFRCKKLPADEYLSKSEKIY